MAEQMVPGLRTLQRGRGSNPLPNRRRVQTDTRVRQAPGLNPQAQRIDNFVQPLAPRNDFHAEDARDLGRLADALSGFGPSLARLGAAFEERQEEDSYAKAQKAVLSRTPEQLQEDVKAGRVPELQTARGMEVFGERSAYFLRDQLIEQYETNFDRDGGNFEEFVTAQVAPFLEQYGNDRLWMENFAKTVQPQIDRLRNVHEKYRQGLTIEGRKQEVHGVWYERTTAQAADGVAPADVAAGVFAEFKTNRDYARLTYKEQQELVMQLADQHATRGRYDLARALVSHERESDGAMRSLLTDVELGDRAHRLLARIDADQLKADRAAHAEAVEQNVVNQSVDAFEKGRSAFIVDTEVPTKDGGTKVLTGDDLRKKAARQYFDKSQEFAKLAGETPGMTMNRELDAFSRNGHKHPQWTPILQSGYQAATGAAIKADGKLPDGLQEASRLYNELHAKNPQYLATMLDRDAMDYYEAVRVLQQDMRQDPISAHTRAIDAMSDPTKFEGPGFQQRFEDLNRQVDKALRNSRGGLWLFGRREAPVNAGTISNEISRIGKLYIKLGLSAEDALEKARETIDQNYVNYRGWMMPINGLNLPGNYEELFDRKIAEFVERNPQLGLEDEDLSIRNFGGGSQWYIYSETLNGYVEHHVGDGSGVINLRDLAILEEDRIEEKVTQIEQDNHDRQRSRTRSRRRTRNMPGTELAPRQGNLTE